METDTGRIVLIIGREADGGLAGLQISAGPTGKIGDFSREWHASSFKRFSGKVTLES